MDGLRGPVRAVAVGGGRSPGPRRGGGPYGVLSRGREIPPAGVPARRDPRQQPDLRRDPARAGRPPQGGGERVVADEGACPRSGAVGEHIGEADGLYGDARVEGGLEGGPAEGAAGTPAPGAALGEDGDAVAGPEGAGECADGGRQRADPVAFDEEGSGAGGEPAQYGPAADVALGERAAGQGRGHEGDVEPGDVVGGDEAGTVGAGAAVDVDAQAEGPQEGGRPGADEGVAGPAGQQPDRRRGAGGDEEQGEGGGDPQEGARDSRGRPVVACAGRGCAGRGRQPGVHADGASERKCRR
ncbi:hypothetical protein GCM10010286_02620 [Streptomyces toxytricini]|nr:hypothetical protein GCM10010286_02620 [Streptomyces toxytricini]